MYSALDKKSALVLVSAAVDEADEEAAHVQAALAEANAQANADSMTLLSADEPITSSVLCSLEAGLVCVYQ